MQMNLYPYMICPSKDVNLSSMGNVAGRTQKAWPKAHFITFAK